MKVGKSIMGQQNRNNDNELQRAIDEITQKGGNNNPNMKQPNQGGAPVPPPMGGMPQGAPMGGMKMPGGPVPPMSMGGAPAGGFGRGFGGYGGGSDIVKVKEAALKELFPIMDRVEIEPEKRFILYQEMLNTMRDKAVIAPAYEAARQIRDDKLRADSLLYLINSIDEMSL